MPAIKPIDFVHCLAAGCAALLVVGCGHHGESAEEAPVANAIPHQEPPQPSRGHHLFFHDHRGHHHGDRDAGIPDASTDASSDASTGAPVDGGFSDDETGGPRAACTGTPLSTPLITDFSDAVSAPPAVFYGTPPSLSGGSFTYAAPGQGSPVLSLVPAGADQALQVTTATGAPSDPGNSWSGFGLYFNFCADARPATGIAFSISGDLGTCSIAFGVGFSEDNSVLDNPLNGACTEALCLAPSSDPIATGATVVHFADLFGGVPVSAVDAAALTAIQWQITAPPGGCSANFTIDDIRFVYDSSSGPDGGGLGDGGTVTFSVDLSKGPARQFNPPASPAPVSDYVYGINAALIGTAISSDLVARSTRWGMIRQGGNAYTSWNWTNNYNNAGSDYCFGQNPGLGGIAVAGAIALSNDGIPAAQAKGEAYLATVPLVDHVAAAYDNFPAVCPVSGLFCDGSTVSSRVNAYGVPFATDRSLGDAGSPAFVDNVAVKPGGGFCTCPPAGPCESGCRISSGPVYQDEFVHFLKGAFGQGGAPIFFSLDNEPNYWGSTHPDLWPFVGTLPCQDYLVTYDDIVGRNVASASAIKAAWPGAKVFGPVVAQDGLVYAHSYFDTHAPAEFLDYYLQQMASASASASAPLLDVLDVHYYSNGGNPTAAQCVQSPRLFWDADYRSLSAGQTHVLDFGWSGIGNYLDSAQWYPRKLIPRLFGKIAAAYPAAAAPGLAITEYNTGCESEIAGGIAQADLLGIFGREGVYAAAAWPLRTLVDNYLLAAFDLYRNYDGHGAVVGDTAVQASTTDFVDTSVYAFAHSGNSAAVDLVAINKANVPVSASIQLAGAPALASARAYALAAGSAAVVPSADPAIPVVCADGACTLSYTMPPFSATTLIVR